LESGCFLCGERALQNLIDDGLHIPNNVADLSFGVVSDVWWFYQCNLLVIGQIIKGNQEMQQKTN
jgi:hypothetical protein